MTQRGVLTVLSGFSGVGKGAVTKRLLEKYDGYALSVSVTTRAPRPGEQDGREYYFRSEEEFQRMIEEDELIEYASFCGHYYGSPRSYVEEQLSLGHDVILEIEIQGARRIRRLFPDALLLFLMPPDAKTLLDRLTFRDTEEKAVIAERLRRAAAEAEGIEEYDYVLVNKENQLEECVDSMHALIGCEHWKVNRNLPFINEVREEIKAL